MTLLEGFAIFTAGSILFTVPAEDIFPWLPWSKKIKDEKLLKAATDLKLEGTGPLTELAIDLDKSDVAISDFVKICKANGINEWTTNLHEARRIFNKLQPTSYKEMAMSEIDDQDMGRPMGM